MLTSKELRTKAWNSLKGKYWMAFIVVIVFGVIMSIGKGMVTGAQTLVDFISMVDPAEMDDTMKIGAVVVLGISSVMSIVGLLISIFLESASQVGLCNYFIKNTDSKPSFGDAFSGFRVRYLRNTWALLLMSIKLILWSFLLVVPGIIKSFEYAIIPYILADDPTISTKDAFKKANVMMKGNKWRLFVLNFSFIGWYLLCFVTFGLGTFFLMPYLNAANAEFYVELKNKQNY